MSKKENNISEEKFKSKIGGQALIEGVMMRGITLSAMACRLPNGEIDVETWEINKGKKAPWYTKTPFVRGCFNFINSMVEGSRCIMKSADKQMTEDEKEEELSGFDKFITEKLGEKGFNVIMAITVVISCAISVALFKFLPVFISNFIIGFFEDGGTDTIRTVTESVVKILLLVGYFYIVSLTKSMKTVFMYHGAEHKTIACYEAKKELTTENVRTMTRFHPRCGTSFIIIVVLISLIVGMFLPWENIWLRFGLQILLLIPEASIAYECIKLAGRFNNVFTKILSAPGLCFQRITTKEPTDAMIEVAIAAIKPCIPADENDDIW